MAGKTSFHSLYSHGFIRAAVCLPRVRVADPRRNGGGIERLFRQAASDGAAVALFPELCISAYSNEDLFHQDALLTASLEALSRTLEGSRDSSTVLIVGAPLRLDGHLFNCAVVSQRGRILGVVPKTYLPTYREFYERRQFTPATAARMTEVRLLGQLAPFGNDLVFEASDLDALRLHVEICEDLWVPVPPSSYAALGGATVLCNLSASNITIGKAEYRRELARSQSGRCVAAYLYSAAGAGESTTDLAWDGHALVAENGSLLAESERFGADEQIVTADIDLDRLLTERMRWTSFADALAAHRDIVRSLRRVPFALEPPRETILLRRKVERFPYVPSEASALDERCEEAYNIQVHGLLGRLAACGLEKVVIGVSGGLDSTHALVVVARAMDKLGLPRSSILAYSLPGFATSERTRKNALALMAALGATASEIDIRPSCEQMLRDIGHPFTEGKPLYDVTFENVQAGQRTSILFRLANHLRGIVIGTSDLSELALGWCTYGVGDHMSHYAVNSSVPKTLIQHLLRWEAQRGELGAETSRLLESILDTEISPELVPGSSGDGKQPGQSTESVIGPYELQDFHLYYTTRFGFRPSKVAYLCHHAWASRDRGPWPAGLREEKRNEYDLKTIKRWLEVFLMRFFQQSQFKRSALPNGPKVGSGGSLSPRADWRAPSDAVADAWLEELKLNVPES